MFVLCCGIDTTARAPASLSAIVIRRGPGRDFLQISSWISRGKLGKILKSTSEAGAAGATGREAAVVGGSRAAELVVVGSIVVRVAVQLQVLIEFEYFLRRRLKKFLFTIFLKVYYISSRWEQSRGAGNPIYQPPSTDAHTSDFEEMEQVH